MYSVKQIHIYLKHLKHGIEKSRLIVVLLLFCLLSSFSFQTHAVNSWQVIPEHSSLSFIAIQEGAKIQGVFTQFTADISFDKNDLKHSQFNVMVDLNSVNTEIPDRDAILRSTDFFSVNIWPNASFKTHEIIHVNNNNYRAKASLKIRDIDLPITFDFTIKITEGNKQTLLLGEGNTTLDRFEYDMAHGDFIDSKTVGAIVEVKVNIRAFLDASP